jgi:hypothetical protein
VGCRGVEIGTEVAVKGSLMTRGRHPHLKHFLPVSAPIYRRDFQ